MRFSAFSKEKFLPLLLLLLFLNTLNAAVFLKGKSNSVDTILGKLSSQVEYASEMEVNGSSGTMTVYSLHELNSFERLVQMFKPDIANFSSDVFSMKLNEEQGGGLLFAIRGAVAGTTGQPVIVMHFDSVADGSPKWLFPELPAPELSSIKLSVNDKQRNMRICTYSSDQTVDATLEGVGRTLLSRGWECATPGNKATALFFVNDDSVILVSAIPSSANSSGCSVLIMGK